MDNTNLEPLINTLTTLETLKRQKQNLIIFANEKQKYIDEAHQNYNSEINILNQTDKEKTNKLDKINKLENSKQTTPSLLDIKYSLKHHKKITNIIIALTFLFLIMGNYQLIPTLIIVLIILGFFLYPGFIKYSNDKKQIEKQKLENINQIERLKKQIVLRKKEILQHNEKLKEKQDEIIQISKINQPYIDKTINVLIPEIETSIEQTESNISKNIFKLPSNHIYDIQYILALREILETNQASTLGTAIKIVEDRKLWEKIIDNTEVSNKLLLAILEETISNKNLLTDINNNTQKGFSELVNQNNDIIKLGNKTNESLKNIEKENSKTNQTLNDLNNITNTTKKQISNIEEDVNYIQHNI